MAGYLSSKTREGAKVSSRDADFLQYEMGNKDPVIGGKRSIGGLNVDQTRRGFFNPSLQSAVDDLYSLTQLPVNAVFSSTVDAPPIAIQQVESITFSGTVTNPNPDETQATIHVYGYPFVFDNTTNASTVCETVFNYFNDQLAANNIVFDHVERKGTNGDILECRFIDAVSHPVTNTIENGITQTGSIDVQAQAGYGTWSKLGSVDLAVTPAVTLFYFKRIA